MMTKFPERLKELRLEKNLRQSDFAEKFKVSKSAVSAWEIGRNQPNYDLLMDIAEFFEISVDYLVGMTDLL